MRIFRKNNPGSPETKTPHHYVLAHVALKQICFQNPLGFFGLMGSPDREEFLNDLWAQVCKNCDKEGQSSFSIDDVMIDTIRIGDYPAVLVTMPKPHHVTEAHMVCIVLMVPLADMKQNGKVMKIHYFTLEKGATEEGQERTVLCEWDEDTHYNYGDGPDPTPEAFIETIIQRLH